jgi:hypothetical protein
MWTKFDKALAALIVSGLVPIAVHFTGAPVSPEFQAEAVTVLTTLFVYLTPNKGSTP